MSYNGKVLKAFIRYDYSGRVIPGALVLRKTKPSVGDWVEIPAYKCCEPRPNLPIFNGSITPSNLTSFSVDLNWNPATEYSENPIIGYDILVDDFSTLFVPSDTTSGSIFTLSSGNTYKIEISIINQKGYEVISDPIFITTP